MCVRHKYNRFFTCYLFIDAKVQHKNSFFKKKTTKNRKKSTKINTFEN